MDPALIRQRQEFMKNAIKSMGISGASSGAQQGGASTAAAGGAKPLKKKKKRSTTMTTTTASSKQPAPAFAASLEDGALLDYEDAGALMHQQQLTNAANMQLLTKIVDYMKRRHLGQQNTWALTLNEILEEMQLLYDVPRRTLAWLNAALSNHPRISVTADDGATPKFGYRPPYRFKTKAQLIALFKKHHDEARGAILLSGLEECISHAEQNMKAFGNHVIDIPTQVNKRKDHAYFYNDPDTSFTIDDDFVRLWKAANVEHLDEKKIEEYLVKHGLTSAKDLTPRAISMGGGPQKRKYTRRKLAVTKVHNVHLDDVLEDYETL